MVKMKKTLSSLAFAATTCGALTAIANPSISVDAVAQRWPWNNKLDIKYTVSGGQNVAAGVFAKVEFTATIDGVEYPIDGSRVGADASDGTHIATWMVPSGLRARNCTMSARLVSSNVPSGDDYMIVDLSTGDVSYEGLYATQDESSVHYNTNDVFKTSKLLLRKVPAGGSYRTGNWSSTNNGHYWTTGFDYYIGVYSVTKCQYERVCGLNPSNDASDGRPVVGVSWNQLRGEGTAPSALIPAAASDGTGTFFQRLNRKTGLYFDLPTEVMFEIAERANATTTYFWGGEWDDDYVVCNDNSGGALVAVGSRLPNAWGLYDVAGNIWEMCLDDDSLSNLANAADPFTPAWNSGTKRSIRGGGTYSVSKEDQRFGASYRNYYDPGNSSGTLGFRVAIVVR